MPERLVRRLSNRHTHMEGTSMKNPWTKKNPLLSMWLSGANAVAGSARSRANAAVKRQATTTMNQGMKQVADFWTDALTGKTAGATLTPPAKPRKKKRRTR